MDATSLDGRVLGIVTGAGPDAGIDLWQKILADNKRSLGTRYRGDVDAPHVIVRSLPELGFGFNFTANRAYLWDALRPALLKLDAEVDAFCIACNILHNFAPEIHALALKAKFVSIVDVAKAEIRERGLKQAGFLSISPVMRLDEGSPYRSLLDSVRLVTPERLESVDAIVMEIKRAGSVSPELRQRFAEIVQALRVDEVLLACTELPMIQASVPGVTQIDLNQALAKRMVREIQAS